jgi:phage I-like protein
MSLVLATAATAELPAIAPEWVQLTPIGVFQGRDGRGPWRVDGRAAAEKVIAASLNYAGAAKPVIDYDHQTDNGVPKGGTAPAAGWITTFQARADGIWARVEWTDKARAAIAAKEYRYLSPVFFHDRTTGDVSVIARASVTNSPNLHIKALASAGAAMSDLLQTLIKLLGLPDVSDESAVVAAIRDLKTRGGGDASPATAANHAGFGAVDPALYVPRDVFETAAVELNSVKAQRLEEHALVKVTAAMQSGKVSPAMRDWALALCRSNPDSFDEFVSRVPPIITPGSQFSTAAGSAAVGGCGRSALSADQLAVCTAMDLDPQDYARNI